MVDSEEQRVAVLLIGGPLLVLRQCESVTLAYHQELLVCDLPVLPLPHLAERWLADDRELVVGDEVAQDLSNHGAASDVVASLGYCPGFHLSRDVSVMRCPPHILEDEAVRVAGIEILLVYLVAPFLEQAYDLGDCQLLQVDSAVGDVDASPARALSVRVDADDDLLLWAGG